MTTIRQLYELQELDLEIAQCHSLISSIDSQLGDRVDLETMHKELENHRGRLHQLRLQQRAQDLDAESVRAKVHDVEGKLYGGSITNLRELEGFVREAAFLRGQLRELDEKLLETMMALEETQERLQSLEEDQRRAEQQWQIRQAELTEERKRQEETLTALEAQRKGLVSHVGQQELKLYENLRASKGGLAIARVERGLCRGCRMALPTHQLQRARAGREPVLCNSCGRVLFIS